MSIPFRTEIKYKPHRLSVFVGELKTGKINYAHQYDIKVKKNFNLESLAIAFREISKAMLKDYRKMK